MEAFSKLKYGTLRSCFVPRSLGFEHSRTVRRGDPAQGLHLFACFLFVYMFVSCFLMEGLLS